MKTRLSFASAILLVIAATTLFSPGHLRTVHGASDYMVLTVKDFESGISYRAVQSHAPIGLLTNPCSQADNFVPTIDWNDGTGEHKPDTNAETKMFYSKVPVIQNGDYLFWDDTHVAADPGPQIVVTKLLVHCLGDPPGDRTYVTRNFVNMYARIPLNQAEFTKNGKAVDTVKGHDAVDLLSITHKFCSDEETHLDIRQSGQTSPHDFVSGGRIARTGQIAAKSSDLGQVCGDRFSWWTA